MQHKQCILQSEGEKTNISELLYTAVRTIYLKGMMQEVLVNLLACSCSLWLNDSFWGELRLS